MTIGEYIQNIDERYRLGNSTEHTFRGDLQQLLESLVPEIRATNEPKRQACGAPDFILTKKDIPVGYIEAKDIGDADLDGIKKAGNKEQFDRYKESLSNLFFTDYINFHLYREGEFVTKVAIAEVTGRGIKPLSENFERFEHLIKDFCVHIGQTIKSPKKLAKMMAGKARLLSDTIERSLTSDEDNRQDSTLKDQMLAFKNILIHDITPKGFADVYAQTIAYGMFAARLHDPSLDDFSRQEAAELIPKSNPFLRKLFQYIAGYDLDDRIKWVVDDLVQIFLACNVKEILKDYGKATKMEDPIIHFYETFLSEYDPKLRKSRGVWYTPQPVVNFIVRAVDDILKTEFDLPQGLADTGKTTIKVDTQTPDKRSATGYKQMEQEVHKVQILDPATGTGTFLAEVVKQIYKKFEGQEGIWSDYVETHLLPRLNGFELLMASYAMAHLQLDLLLSETGYTPSPSFGGARGGQTFGGAGGGQQRFRVYLTNSLEEYHKDTGTLFASWLSTEATEANRIKRDTPVMCIIGNPPYSGESANKGEWIMNLMEDYKKEPGGKEKLKERNPKWINNDYVKFLRYGQHFIEKNGSGVLAFITDNSFLDSLTFRGMRWNVLKTYDEIYILDLHGNAKKKETAPDGSPDQNVFDIMQGVSINLFIKTGKKKANELGQVYHCDLYGRRDFKYDFLNNNSLKSIGFQELTNVEPMYFMVQKDFEAQQAYDKGFSVSDLFPVNSVGIVTARDTFVIDENKKDLKNRIEDFFLLTKEELQSKYNLKENKRWKIDDVKLIAESFKGRFISPVSYRPFDNRHIYFDDSFIERSRKELMEHFLEKNNIGINLCRQLVSDNYTHMFITNKIVDDSFVSNKSRERGYVFPLYLYPEASAQQTIEELPQRVPNLNMEIVNQIAEGLGLRFVGDERLVGQVHQPPKGGLSSAISSPPLEGPGEVNPLEGPGEVGSPPLEGLGEVKDDKEEVKSTRPGYITANADTYSLLKGIRDELKSNPTEAEALLWEHLRGKKIGHKIRRQHIVGNYIPDFICLRKRLVIEVDGEIHLQQQQEDAHRTLELNRMGYSVIRFTNEEVLLNPQEVAEEIKEVLDSRPDYKINSPYEEDLSDINPPPQEGQGEVRDEKGEVNLSEGQEILQGHGQTPNPQRGFSSTKNSPPLEGSGEVFTPIDLLDYIYAVLHSPTYREKYKEFLKIDFPRVPYPKDKNTFWQLVSLGGEIRQIHLLESPTVEQYITQYPINGDNVVDKIKMEMITEIKEGDAVISLTPIYEETSGRVYINDTQYFDNVPLVAWDFYIGGYQPAQKWLKDRRNRKLEFEDILHYQKIIVALTETHRLMLEIDKINFLSK